MGRGEAWQGFKAQKLQTRWKQVSAHKFVHFLQAQAKITTSHIGRIESPESQNSRGWKGPLWVI